MGKSDLITTKKAKVGVNEPGKNGRPRIEIVLDQLLNLVRMHCTAAECASFFRMSTDTLDRRIKELTDVETGELFKGFADYYKKESPYGRASLRRMLYESARDGSVPVQIFLAKQPEEKGGLGMSDKIDHEIAGTVEHKQVIDWDAIPLDDRMRMLEALKPLENNAPIGAGSGH